MALRWLCFAAGIVVLLGTAISVVGTLVVPRSVSSRVSRLADSVVDGMFRFATRPMRGLLSRDRMLVWQAPVSLLVRIALWTALLVLGYGLVLIPLVTDSVGHAFSEAGSSMFTLGYAAPHTGTSTAVDYVAAYTGLVVVGLQVAYLPTLYAAFNKRETLVTLLVSRAGVPAWGPEILARTRWGFADADSTATLNRLFTEWEQWSAEVAESHTTYLALVRLRSPRPLSHWLTSILAVMDAAALHLALSPSTEPKQTARLCLRMGFVALDQIAGAMRLPTADDPDPDTPISVTYEQFAEAVEMLRALDYPVERTAEQAWPHFHGWRANYDVPALAMARELDAPPALWSGTRRFPSTPLPPRRPASRLPREDQS